MRQQPDRLTPMADPGDLDRIGSRTDPLDGALGHVGGNGCHPINTLATVAVDIDQRRDVRDLVLDQRGGFLALLQRLGHHGDQGQLLDPETGLDLLRPVAKQLRQPGDIAHRFCRA